MSVEDELNDIEERVLSKLKEKQTCGIGVVGFDKVSAFMSFVLFSFAFSSHRYTTLPPPSFLLSSPCTLRPLTVFEVKPLSSPCFF